MVLMQLLRRYELAVLVAQGVTTQSSQFFSFETVPKGLLGYGKLRTLRVWRVIIRLLDMGVCLRD
jgi:hypothetical protein